MSEIIGSVNDTDLTFRLNRLNKYKNLSNSVYWSRTLDCLVEVDEQCNVRRTSISSKNSYMIKHIDKKIVAKRNRYVAQVDQVCRAYDEHYISYINDENFLTVDDFETHTIYNRVTKEVYQLGSIGVIIPKMTESDKEDAKTKNPSKVTVPGFIKKVYNERLLRRIEESLELGESKGDKVDVASDVPEPVEEPKSSGPDKDGSDYTYVKSLEELKDIEKKLGRNVRFDFDLKKSVSNASSIRSLRDGLGIAFKLSSENLSVTKEYGLNNCDDSSVLDYAVKMINLTNNTNYNTEEI